MNHFNYQGSMILSCFVLLLLSGCQEPKGSPTTPAEQLYTEVMTIHDEVMPKIGTIQKLIKDLKLLRERVETDSLRVGRIDTTLVELSRADEAMMDWMHQIRPLATLQGQSEEKVISYLENEKIKITKVKDDILGSIRKGEALVEELQQESDSID